MSAAKKIFRVRSANAITNKLDQDAYVLCMYVVFVGVNVECLEIDRYVERKDCSRLFCSDGRTGEYFPKPQKFIHIRLTGEIQVAGRVAVIVERIWSRYDGDGGWSSAVDRR